LYNFVVISTKSLAAITGQLFTVNGYETVFFII